MARPQNEDRDSLIKLLVPAASDVLTPVAVSKCVNSVKNDDAECLQPAEPFAAYTSVTIYKGMNSSLMSRSGLVSRFAGALKQQLAVVPCTVRGV